MHKQNELGESDFYAGKGKGVEESGAGDVMW